MPRSWLLATVLLVMGCTGGRQVGEADSFVTDLTAPDAPDAAIRPDAALPGGSYLWLQRVWTGSESRARDVAVDAQGNAYVVGRAPGPGEAGLDAFVVSYTASGQPRWKKMFGGPGQDQANAVAVDGAGNVYVTGEFGGTVDFGGGALTSKAMADDVFLVSYTASGAHRWSRALGGTENDTGLCLGTDPAGNVYLAGAYYSDDADFGGAPLGNGTVAAQMFVASYDSQGTHRWSEGHGGPADDIPHDLAVDTSGNVYVVGEFRISTQLGGIIMASHGGADAFLASYDSLGAHRWSASHGGTGYDAAQGVTTTPDGTVHVAGWFAASVSFGGKDLVSAGGKDGFVASYTPLGAHRWSKRIGGGAGDLVMGIAGDGDGNIHVTGCFADTASLGGSSFTSAGWYDIFVASYRASTGAHRWSRAFGGASGDEPVAVAVGPVGNVYVAGQFQESVDFGGGPLTSADLDAFVLKLTP